MAMADEGKHIILPHKGLTCSLKLHDESDYFNITVEYLSIRAPKSGIRM
jgi:hypothetical protein